MSHVRSVLLYSWITNKWALHTSHTRLLASINATMRGETSQRLDDEVDQSNSRRYESSATRGLMLYIRTGQINVDVLWKKEKKNRKQRTGCGLLARETRAPGELGELGSYQVNFLFLFMFFNRYTCNLEDDKLEQMVQKRAPRDRANLGTMTDGDG